MKPKGIALIQVLIIAACLSVIGIFMSGSAKIKVANAKLAVDKSYAYVNAHSLEAKVTFHLLANSWLELDKRPLLDEKVTLNTYGNPVMLKNGSNVRVQDLTGLLNVNYPSLEMFDRLLKGIGVDFSQRKLVISRLLDWKDIDMIERANGTEKYARNGIMLDRSDIFHAIQLEKDKVSEILPFVTLFSASHFNPALAPKDLLIYLFGQEKATQIIALREAKKGRPIMFGSYLGTYDYDEIAYIPGNVLQIRIVAQYREAIVKSGFTIELFPYEDVKGKAPFNVFEREISW
ncbi:hypothetical protein [Pseudoalteromonas xiamenensis]